RLADSQNEALDRPLWGTILRSAPWNHPVVTAQLRTPSDGLRCANSVTSPLQGGGWVGVPPLAGTQVDDQGDVACTICQPLSRPGRACSPTPPGQGGRSTSEPAPACQAGCARYRAPR